MSNTTERLRDMVQNMSIDTTIKYRCSRINRQYLATDKDEESSESVKSLDKAHE